MPWGKGDSIVAGEEAQLEPVARAGNGKGQGTGGRWPRGSTLMTKQMHKNSRNPDDPREKLKKNLKKISTYIKSVAFSLKKYNNLALIYGGNPLQVFRC